MIVSSWPASYCTTRRASHCALSFIMLRTFLILLSNFCNWQVKAKVLCCSAHLHPFLSATNLSARLSPVMSDEEEVLCFCNKPEVSGIPVIYLRPHHDTLSNFGLIALCWPVSPFALLCSWNPRLNENVRSLHRAMNLWFAATNATSGAT